MSSTEMKRAYREFIIGLIALAFVLICRPLTGNAQATAPCLSPRPAFATSPYDENYSFLKNEHCRTDLWDPLKYIPLNSSGRTFVSLGGQVRERYEFFDNYNWGQGPQSPDGYLLQRYMLHGDVHITSRFRVFGELKSGIENGRTGGPRPIDEDQFDVHQALIDIKPLEWSNGSLAVRAGRQELSFGSLRVVSVREGPNVRQSFDGFRMMIQAAKWRVDAFATKPVETNPGILDDSPDHARSFWGVYGTTPITAEGNLNIDLYYFGLDRKNAAFNKGVATEERHSVGTRLWGRPGPWDYNFEALFQWGSFGQGNIRAWTLASDTGYTVQSWSVHPRVALKADIASGDKNPADRNLHTFSGLFPKGAYFSEADLIGPANFIDVHPDVSVPLTKSLILTTDTDFFWRQSVNDGIYGIALNLLRRGQSNRERYIGGHVSAEMEFRLDRHTTFVWEYLHFFAGPFLTQSPPGKNINYVTGWAVYKF